VLLDQVDQVGRGYKTGLSVSLKSSAMFQVVMAPRILSCSFQTLVVLYEGVHCIT
jgi:hypothetical protein